MKDITFDVSEFARRLNLYFREEGLVNKIILHNYKYLYCLGLLEKTSWDAFFETENEVAEFVARHKIQKRIVYSPLRFEEIIIHDFGISEDDALFYTFAEEFYMRELGILGH